MEIGGASASSSPPPRIVPSDEYPTLAVALLDAEDGSHIKLLPDYREELKAPLIIDKRVFVEGPDDSSALLFGHESIIVAAGTVGDAVLLKRLRIRMYGDPNLVALVIVGGCTLEDCDVMATAVGIEVASRTGNTACLRRTRVHQCVIGVSLAGGALSATIEDSRIENCSCGISLTGLDVQEGWNDSLASLIGATLVDNEQADLRLRGWSIHEKVAGAVRCALPNEEVSVRGWPSTEHSEVVTTDRGPVILLFDNGRINVTIFDKEDNEHDADGTGGRCHDEEYRCDFFHRVGGATAKVTNTWFSNSQPTVTIGVLSPSS